MRIESIADILDAVKTAGQIALEGQRKLDYSRRSYKSDGSVLTETDKRVERYLAQHIEQAYPDANVLAEETVRDFDRKKSFTFAIDPIDGTDVFSQGMSGWCISVGLLDAYLVPIAGAVFAPKLNLLFFADMGKKAFINGVEINAPFSQEYLSPTSNIMVSSRVHQEFDLSKYPGKIRNIGSAALHLCFPLIYPGIFGAVQSPVVHIWDIAGAHAINLSVGLDFEYLGGGHIDYSTMIDGGSAIDFILAGTQKRIGQLRDLLVKIE